MPRRLDLVFTGLLPVSKPVDVLILSDLHLDFTVPFVLSWSLMDALACGCTVLVSETAPVREMIHDGRNGLLCGFYDRERFAERPSEVLREPAAFQRQVSEATQRIRRECAIDVTLPRLARLLEQVADDRLC